MSPPTLDAFRLMVLPGTEYRRKAAELEVVFEPKPYHYIISHYTMSAQEINRAERMAQAMSIFYNLKSTRQEMFRQAREGNERVVDFCDSIGVYMDHFNLVDRAELRKGNLIREKEEDDLLEILRDFEHFRNDLRMHPEKMGNGEEPSVHKLPGSYAHVPINM
jgi:hypothetical protein